MYAELMTLKELLDQAVQDITKWIAETVYQDPNHEIKKRTRQVGGHIPTTKDRPANARRSGRQEGMRSLTPEDISDFEEAAEKRPSRTSKGRMDDFLEEMWTGLNYGRMRRLRQDMKWLRKKAVRHGIPPENIPWQDI